MSDFDVTAPRDVVGADSPELYDLAVIIALIGVIVMINYMVEVARQPVRPHGN